MNIIAVDDEKLALENLTDCLSKIMPSEDIHSFRFGKEAKDYCENNEIDIAFLDIEMRDMDGMTLAKEIKLKHPQVNIIFTTGYNEYAVDAMKMHASGYITKPVSPEKIQKEIDDLRHPLDLPVKEKNEVFAKAFGNFEFYVNSETLEFRYNKSKELLAFLIDRRGSMCSVVEIEETLWEDDDENHRSYLKNIRTDLKETLKKAGCENLLVIQWGKMGIDTSRLSCDYYDWLDGKASGINAYRGEYMSQYSWAEFTNGRLEMESRKN